MPSGRGEDAEFWADENEFVFSSRPYFLRLHLPGPVIEDGREHSAFDWSTNELKISIPKKNENENFSDLDMMTKLLTKRQKRGDALVQSADGKISKVQEQTKPLIEIIDENNIANENQNDISEDDDEFDYEFEQKVPNEPDIQNKESQQQHNNSKQNCYGFNHQYSGEFENEYVIKSGMWEGIDICKLIHKQQQNDEESKIGIEEIDNEFRLSFKNRSEDEKFDGSHFISDAIDEEKILKGRKRSEQSKCDLKCVEEEEEEEDYLLHSSFDYIQTWNRDKSQFHRQETPSLKSKETFIDSTLQTISDASSSSSSTTSIWTKQEQDILSELRKHITPHVEFIIRHEQLGNDFVQTPVYALIFDLLFAICYDLRMTDGEGSPESSWTISTLSGSLSYLVSFSSLREAIISCIRRSLCFPLFRGPQFALTVLSDVISLLQGTNDVEKGSMNNKLIIEGQR